jgi:hypothetical protein
MCETVQRRFGFSVATGFLALIGLAALTHPTLAQTAAPQGAGDNQSKIVGLVPQDFSDCTNGNVVDNGNWTKGGLAYVSRNTGGTTTVKVSATLTPNMTYHFFLKCVRLLGDIKTDEEGLANAEFSFQTNSVGNVFAFDMYPEGAPAGNKYQSVQVSFQ